MNWERMQRAFWEQVGDPVGEDRDRRISHAVSDARLSAMAKNLQAYSDEERVRYVAEIADCLAGALERAGLPADPEAGALVWERSVEGETHG